MFFRRRHRLYLGRLRRRHRLCLGLLRIHHWLCRYCRLRLRRRQRLIRFGIDWFGNGWSGNGRFGTLFFGTLFALLRLRLRYGCVYIKGCRRCRRVPKRAFGTLFAQFFRGLSFGSVTVVFFCRVKKKRVPKISPLESRTHFFALLHYALRVAPLRSP